MEVNDITVIGVLLAGLGAVSGALKILWNKVLEQHKETLARLDECEKDRAELWKHIAQFSNPGRV